MISYTVGLIITSICVGKKYTELNGWLVFGIGLMLYGTVQSMLQYLNTPTSQQVRQDDIVT